MKEGHLGKGPWVSAALAFLFPHEGKNKRQVPSWVKEPSRYLDTLPEQFPVLFLGVTPSRGPPY